MSYIAAEYDGDDVEGYAELARRLTAFDGDGGPGGRRLFYLATPPSLAVPIMRHLTQARLAGHAYRPADGGWARLVVEKPFGHDVSARALDADIARGFDDGENPGVPSDGAGSVGPVAADEPLSRDGRRWYHATEETPFVVVKPHTHRSPALDGVDTRRARYWVLTRSTSSTRSTTS